MEKDDSGLGSRTEDVFFLVVGTANQDKLGQEAAMLLTQEMRVLVNMFKQLILGQQHLHVGGI